MNSLQINRCIDLLSFHLKNEIYNEIIYCIENNNFKKCKKYLYYLNYIDLDNKLFDLLCNDDALMTIDNKFYFLLYKQENYSSLIQKIISNLLKLYNNKNMIFIEYFNKMNNLIIILNNKFNIKNETLLELIYKSIIISYNFELNDIFNYLISNKINYKTLFYTINNTSNIDLIHYILFKKLTLDDRFNIDDYYIIDCILKIFENNIDVNKIIYKINSFSIFYDVINNCNKFIKYPIIQKLLYTINKITFDDCSDNIQLLELKTDFLKYFLNHFDKLNKFKYFINYKKHIFQVSLLHLLIYNPECDENELYINKLFLIMYYHQELINDCNNEYHIYPIQLAIYNHQVNIIEKILDSILISRINLKISILKISIEENQTNLIEYSIVNQLPIHLVRRMINLLNYDIIETLNRNKENLLVLMLRYYDYDTIKIYFQKEILNYGIIRWIQIGFNKI